MNELKQAGLLTKASWRCFAFPVSQWLYKAVLLPYSGVTVKRNLLSYSPKKAPVLLPRAAGRINAENQ